MLTKGKKKKNQKTLEKRTKKKGEMYQFPSDLYSNLNFQNQKLFVKVQIFLFENFVYKSQGFSQSHCQKKDEKQLRKGLKGYSIGCGCGGPFFLFVSGGRFKALKRVS